MKGVVKSMDAAMASMNLEQVRIHSSLFVFHSKNSSNRQSLTSLVLTRLFTTQMSMLMAKFEQQFDSLDVQAQYMDAAMNATTTTAMPEVRLSTVFIRISIIFLSWRQVHFLYSLSHHSVTMLRAKWTR